jgi:hypothetical protein
LHKVDDDNHTKDDGKTCGDRDDCLINNGDCNQVCINRVGLPRLCGCHSGFRMQEIDNNTCVDVNECEQLGSEIACGHGECSNSPGSYACQCHRGFGHADDGVCRDLDECKVDVEACGEGGVCVNLPGSYECKCDRGYIFKNASGCVDVNECHLGNPCVNGDCINLEPGYNCLCFGGFVFRSLNFITKNSNVQNCNPRLITGAAFAWT